MKRTLLCLVALLTFAGNMLGAVGTVFKVNVTLTNLDDPSRPDITLPMTYKVLTEDGTTGTVQVNDAVCYTTTGGNTAIDVSKITEDGYTFEIPEHVTNSGITYTITAIGFNAFRIADKIGRLRDIAIPSTVTSIGGWAFEHVTWYGDLVIPDNVTYIEGGLRPAFNNCGILNDGTIRIGKGLADTNGGNPFFITRSFGTIPIAIDEENTMFHVDGNCLIETATNRLVAAFNFTELPDYIETIGYGACGLNAIGDVVIPDGVTSIEDEAFYFSVFMKSICIPEGITSIGTMTFGACYQLETINLPSTITSIGHYAFYHCPVMKSFFCHAATPPTLDGDKVFYNSSYKDCVLYVPAGSKAAYEAAAYWQDFKMIVEMEDWTLTVTNAMFATFYLDRPVRIPRENADLLGMYTARELVGDELTLDKFEGDVVPAFTPVLVFANPGTYTFPFEATTESAETGDVMKGVVEDTAVESLKTDGNYRNILTLGRGNTGGFIGFYSYTKETLPAYKCYIGLETGSTASVKVALPDGTETKISDLDVTDSANEGYYDLSGRRVSQPAKGLYIVNGKKVMMK